MLMRPNLDWTPTSPITKILFLKKQWMENINLRSYNIIFQWFRTSLTISSCMLLQCAKPGDLFLFLQWPKSKVYQTVYQTETENLVTSCTWKHLRRTTVGKTHVVGLLRHLGPVERNRQLDLNFSRFFSDPEMFIAINYLLCFCIWGIFQLFNLEAPPLNPYDQFSCWKLNK